MSTGGNGEENVQLVDESENESKLDVKKHSAFWLRHLRMLPSPYVSGDLQR
jgi:hypothetical protein